jgi:alkaline phosphatase D
MSRRFSLFSLLFFAAWSAAPCRAADKPVSRIIFGSCAGQDRPQPFWKTINALHPDLFLMLGDNVYADTLDPGAMRHVYQALADKPGFQRMIASTTVMSTWDDHDFGYNDAGAENRNKVAAQRIFLDFWGVPADSPRRKREGVYNSEIFGPPGRRVQVILLDARYFRSEQRRGKQNNTYLPDNNPQKTILGAAQWEWLKERLREPAEIRLIGSSIQFVAEDQLFEKWANFPHERERLLREIRAARARGVIILSGDRHHAELSVLPNAVGYDLWDFTSSSFNKPHEWLKKEPPEKNVHRVGPLVREANFGLVDIDWDAPVPSLTFEIWQSTGTRRFSRTVPLDRLAPAGQ